MYVISCHFYDPPREVFLPCLTNEKIETQRGKELGVLIEVNN